LNFFVSQSSIPVSDFEVGGLDELQDALEHANKEIGQH
jgi:hypothetical protein